MNSLRTRHALILILALLAPYVAAQDGGSLFSAQEETPAEPPPPLSPEVDARADTTLAEGLRRRFAAIEGLGDVVVEVTAGVVHLSGTVLAESERDEAERIARRTTGVAAVDNDVVVELGVRERLTPTLENANETLKELVARLPLLAIALGIVFLFALLARLAGRWEAPYRRLSPSVFVRDLTRQGVRAAIFLIGVLIALELLDAAALVGAVLGTAGVLGLALGFAFRDMAENFIASVLLSLRQPFAPNDLVDVDGREGKVVRLTSRATILMTLDGNHLRIPNAQVYKGVILNYTRNPRRRFGFNVGVGVGEDLGEAQRLGVECLRSMDGVLGDPPPWAQIEDLGDSSVLIRFHGWVDQTDNDFSKTRGEAIRLVKTALEAAGLDLPEPIYRVQLSRARPPQPASSSPPSPASEVETDLSAGDPVDDQIADELATSREENLLNVDAPQE